MIFTKRSVIEDNHLRFYEGILHEDNLFKQINFFIYTMLWQWGQMTRREQDSRESNEYFARVKPLVKKYGGGKSLILFYASHSLYRTYLWARHTAGKVLHRG